MIALTRNTAAGKVKRIVVTGAGVVSCFGQDVDHFYDSLLQGKSGVRKVEAFDVDGWQTDFAAWISQDKIDVAPYINKRLQRRLDPFLKYAIVAGKKALESAGLALDSEALEALDKSRAGVLCGSGMGGLRIYAEGVEKLLHDGYDRMSPFFIPYAITNMVRSSITTTSISVFLHRTLYILIP